ncbi:metallophosphoesterase [Catenulispora acidiphila DSM 44928]|uniref:Metallophosphoesterase n=1 Tax=Catenulispora acidiphila (strain DSM 44928 / JCM 14897 / NBRC 102108 / NRRL B-24433 / ID139908) TaxID=479433 RepID=C7Q3U3_CATAD|nr:metallophosphoesterase [Catenulispora acidiphila]ACU77701.1 metallophosphoesterase [Catenulispora acidiphila DSM 44928]
MPVVIAHVSDIHIDAGPRAAERTRRVFDHLDALPADLDLVVLTGDIADHGLDSEYETVRQATATRHPLLVCPGNHDDREAFRRALLGVPASTGPINQVHRTDRFVVALCDSSIPKQDDGFLADETLAWLAAELDATPDGVPVLIGFHHPPVELHTPFVDKIRQFGEERLAEAVAGRQNVVALLAGHAHTAAATHFAGLPLLVAPGVVSTIPLPWEGERALHLDHQPSLAFHVIDDRHRITTHFRSIV